MITKKQIQKVKDIGSKARKSMTKVIVKKVKRFSDSNKRLG
jgi:hypothetical protein